MEMKYRKGDTNQADPLSRRPDLMGELTESSLDASSELFGDLEAALSKDFEREVESFTHALGAMVTLQSDVPLLDKIKIGYNDDSTFSGDTVPAGVTYDDHT